MPDRPPRARILVLEDDAATREVLVEALRQAGYSVVEAATVDAARVLRDFDVALVDVHLPDGSGLDALKAWRSAGMDVAAIMLTGERSADAIGRAFLSLDAWDYLEKPFDIESLERVIEDAVRRLAVRRTLDRKLAG